VTAEHWWTKGRRKYIVAKVSHIVVRVPILLVPTEVI
jgi:hypothetical protein